MSAGITELIVEEATLTWLEELGYTVINGPNIASGEPYAERTSYSEVVLSARLLSTLQRINPDLASDTLEEVIRKITRIDTPNLYENNRRFHKYITDGADVEYSTNDGRIIHDKAWLIDFSDPENNDWLAVNQFTVIENKNNRRCDVVIFVNGLPLGVIELKNPGDENATIKGAFNQLQTYKKDIPSIFPYNEILVISDGLEARAGTLTADWERFMPWRTIDGIDLAPKSVPEMEVLVKGIFEKPRFLDLISKLHHLRGRWFKDL